MPKVPLIPLLLLIAWHSADGQAADFLHPQQKGPFPVNGLSYLELWSYTDPPQIGYPVPTLDQIIPEIQATGTNLVKFTVTLGQVKNYRDNAYDQALPFPVDGAAANLIAFGHKLTAQGLPCLLVPFSSVENVIVGSSNTSHIDPTDRRAFMTQHVPRLVSMAQIAESMGCQYFALFGDDLEHMAADPTLTDLWMQAITQIRAVFSGRITSMASWGEHGGQWTFDFPAQMIGMLDVFGAGFGPAFTDHADPTVAELVASYHQNSEGHNTLEAFTDLHRVYGKPILATDIAWGSFTGSNVSSDGPLFGEYPSSQFTVDYQEQTNLYQAFFQAMPALDPNWMLGGALDSFDRFPYAWKDVNLPPYLGSWGESLRGKPALQTITQANQTSQPLRTPANGWWYNPATPGVFYTIEAENGVVRLGSLAYSAQGVAQWTLARCVQTAPGSSTYVGTAEQYTGGQALNRTPAPPTGIVDGLEVELVFNSTTTAMLQIGTQRVPIQRYQFSTQWASPMLNAPLAGWWDQPNPSGRGYFLEVQGNTLFAGGLIYSASGQPSWFTSTGPVDATGAFTGNLTVCTMNNGAAPVCTVTADTMQLKFSSPWHATLTLSQEAPVELRRHRPAEIGWAGSMPSFAMLNPQFTGQAAIADVGTGASALSPGSTATITGTGLTRGVSGLVPASSSDLPYSIRGTSVLVNGMPARLMSVANINGQEQITFEMPTEVQGEPIPAVPYQYQVVVTSAPVVSIVVVNNGAVSPALWALLFYRQNTPGPELILDGGFETSPNGAWGLYVGSPGAATSDLTTAAAQDGSYSEHVSVSAAATNANVQLYQSNLAVTLGTIYEFQFWGKSSNARQMQVSILKGGGDFHSYGLSTVYTLGATWQLYRAAFQATETASDARLIFYLGAQTGEVWLDGVELMAVGAAQPGNNTAAPQSGWWWDPNLNGTGYFIEYGGGSGTGIFAGAFLYDGTGNATWLVSTGQLSGTTYTGKWLKATGGQTLLGPYQAASLAPAGNLGITFTDATHAVMARPDGTQINLQRYSFTASATPATPVTGAPQSGWWWAGPALSGTGYGIEIQGSSVFIVAYVYDNAGNPVWRLATGALTSPSVYSGTWDVYAGGPQLTSLEGSYGARDTGPVSPMTLTFSDATHGTLTMGNVTLPIARFQQF